jgi:hypothetical protein
MPVLLLFVFRFVRLLFSGDQAVAIENAALCMQIAAFQRKRKRPLLTTWDRVFWITLRLWSDWRHPLIYVQADTVVRWQRERFRRFWARLSKTQRRRRGRPGTAAELRRLIEQMAAANPLWRAPRIHGELKMLGIAISERTVSRILRRLRRRPNQTWKTFLHNHIGLFGDLPARMRLGVESTSVRQDERNHEKAVPVCGYRLPRPARVSGQRRYSQEASHTIAVLRLAQACGFHLDDFALVFQLHGDGGIWHEKSALS